VGSYFHFPYSSAVAEHGSRERRCHGCKLSAAIAAVTLAAGLVPVAHAGNAVININMQTAIPIAAGFSGFNAPQLRNGVEYFDPKFVAAVAPLKPGWIRFPAGTASMAFDWNAGHINTAWLQNLTSGSPPLVSAPVQRNLTAAQVLTQAKGGVWLSDFATFANSLGAAAIICFNGFTDTNPSSAAQMALAAQSLGLNVVEWELSNEPYVFPLIFPTAASYAAAMNSPYFNDLVSAAPAATAGLFSAGLFPGQAVDPAWDTGLSTYTPHYWNASSIHVYPIANAVGTSNTVKTLNGILAHGSADYINSYLLPVVGANAPIFISELNCCTQPGYKFLGYLYNGIFLAEYIARLSSVPNVKAVGVNSLYTDNFDFHGVIQSVNDFETYLGTQVAANPNFSTNTATDPNTQYQFYTSAPGLALVVANQAINSSTQIWPTTVTGGPTVSILGYDGLPIPAIYAQAYLGNNGSHYLLITNKSGKPQNITVQVNGVDLSASFSLTYVSSSTLTVANSATAPNNVQIQTATSGNPVTIGPYSVTCVTW
jgi:hypothetical protein